MRAFSTYSALMRDTVSVGSLVEAVRVSSCLACGPWLLGATSSLRCGYGAESTLAKPPFSKAGTGWFRAPVWSQMAGSNPASATY